MNLERALLAAITAALLGIIYAFITHQMYRHDPTTPYTSVMVVFGVTLTLLAAAIIVPIEWIAVFCGLFAITGIPQILGSMLRESQARRRLLDEAKRHITETLS